MDGSDATMDADTGKGIDLGQRAPPVLEEGGAAKVHLTLAIADYEHVRDLVHGIVRPDGIALTPIVLEVEEIFYRLLKNLEWDVSECSFAKFTALTAQGTAPSVGIPQWAQTAGIFARGMLAETYGVDLAKIRWVQAGVDQAGRAEKVDVKLPKGIRYEQRPDASLSSLLTSGDIDAAISARVPGAFAAGGDQIARLFPGYQDDDLRYFEQTKIFPIMHVLVLRRAAPERYPWLAKNLFKAFEAAKHRSLERVRDITASRIPLPGVAALAETLAKTFGEDPFPYGIEGNRPTLDAFCRFAHAQGLTARLLAPDDLFPPQVRGAGVRV